MQFGRILLYISFVSLLVATFFASHSVRVDAADYAKLPATAAETRPLKTGDAAPGFTVRTVHDEPFEFDPANLERPTILISFRGGWCAYCNMHLSELRTVVPELKADGFDILFLSNDPPAQLYDSLKMETQADIEGLDYTILSDAEIVAARAFGTAFRTDKRLTDHLDSKHHDYSGSSIGKHNALAVPAVYVIDTSGTIIFDFVNADYKIRLPAEELKTAARNAL